MKEVPVPVLMYHTTGIPNKNWNWKHLTCPHDIFENQMKWLKKRGFVTVTLKDLYDYIFNGKSIPERSVILTFDDGYADNWIFAYPAMEKHGMRGTIFINPEFVDRRDILRKRKDQFTSTDEIDPFDTYGFLSWPEILECQRSGIFEIESHAMSHTWHPVSERIIDFRHPGDKYIWMTWNRHPERKPYLQFDDPELIDFGEPVYEHGKSLSSRRFFPNPKIAETLIEYVRENGRMEFFMRNDHRDILFGIAGKLQEEMDPGRYETEEEFRERVRKELLESRMIMEEKLNKKIEFLCWPGGSSTETGLEIARETGYKMTTAGRDLPRSIRRNLLNIPSQDSDRISRISPVLYWNGRTGSDSRMIYDSGFTLTLRLLDYKKIYPSGHIAKFIRKGVKFIRKIF